MQRIFINYRREDSAAYAGRLYDHLANHFGDDSIFMDIDQIEPGEDFSEVIKQKTGSVRAAVVLIGRQWLTVTDASGQRRLDDPDDFVRLEIAALLERKIRVIPVLVGGAVVPRASQLPPPLATLVRRNAIEIRDIGFRQDVDRLIEALQKILVDPAPEVIPKAKKTDPQPDIVPASAPAEARVPDEMAPPRVEANSTAQELFARSAKSTEATSLESSFPKRGKALESTRQVSVAPQEGVRSNPMVIIGVILIVVVIGLLLGYLSLNTETAVLREVVPEVTPSANGEVASPRAESIQDKRMENVIAQNNVGGKHETGGDVSKDTTANTMEPLEKATARIAEAQSNLGGLHAKGGSPGASQGKKRTGWVYLGNYNASEGKWETRYFDFDPTAGPTELSSLVLKVREETGAIYVRVDMPSSSGEMQTVKDVLKPLRSVRVKSVKEWYSSGFIWAEVEYEL